MDFEVVQNYVGCRGLFSMVESPSIFISWCERKRFVNSANVKLVYLAKWSQLKIINRHVVLVLIRSLSQCD